MELTVPSVCMLFMNRNWNDSESKWITTEGMEIRINYLLELLKLQSA